MKSKKNSLLIIFILFTIGISQVHWLRSEFLLPEVIPKGGTFEAVLKCYDFDTFMDTISFNILYLDNNIFLNHDLSWTALNPNNDTLTYPMTVTIPDNDTTGFRIAIGKSPLYTSGYYYFVTTGDSTQYFKYDIKERVRIAKKHEIMSNPFHPSRTQHGYQYPIELPGYVPGMYNKSELDTTGRIARTRQQILEDNPPTPEEKIQHLKEIGNLSMLQQALSREDYTEYKSNYLVTQEKKDGINRIRGKRVSNCDPDLNNYRDRRPEKSLELKSHFSKQKLNSYKLINERFEQDFPPQDWRIESYLSDENLLIQSESGVKTNKRYFNNYYGESAAVHYNVNIQNCSPLNLTSLILPLWLLYSHLTSMSFIYLSIVIMRLLFGSMINSSILSRCKKNVAC